MLPAVGAAGEIYQCTAADGSKTFQATPCPSDATEDRKVVQSSATTTSSDSTPADDSGGASPTSCRSGVLRDYEGVPKEIEAYYKKRRRQCRESFKNGSFQIKNCYEEQEEIRTKKYKDLEKYKKQALAGCN